MRVPQSLLGERTITMLLRGCVLAVVSGIALPQMAQEIKLFGISHARYSASALNDYPDTDIDYVETGGFLTIPLISKDSSDIFVNLLSYKQLNAGLNNSVLYDTKRVEQDYHVASYTLNWIHRFGKKWLMLTSVNPTLSSDLEEKISGDDFLVLGALMLRRTAHPVWKWGIGISYNTGFGRPLLMPVAELSYRKMPFSFSALLPVSVTALYHRPSDRLRMGVQAALDGSYFNLGVPDVIPGQTAPVDKVEYSRINIGPVVDIRVVGNFRMELAGGVSTNRLLRFVNADDGLIDLTATTGPFLRAGIAYVIKLPEAP